MPLKRPVEMSHARGLAGTLLWTNVPARREMRRAARPQQGQNRPAIGSGSRGFGGTLRHKSRLESHVSVRRHSPSLRQNLNDLKVISRTSTQKYKSVPDNLREIAKQLGVANVLEGRCNKTADRVRVNVQLAAGFRPRRKKCSTWWVSIDNYQQTSHL